MLKVLLLQKQCWGAFSFFFKKNLPRLFSPYQNVFPQRGKTGHGNINNVETKQKKPETRHNNFLGTKRFFKLKKFGSGSRPPREKPRKPSKIIFSSNLPSIIVRRGQFHFEKSKESTRAVILHSVSAPANSCSTSYVHLKIPGWHLGFQEFKSQPPAL